VIVTSVGVDHALFQFGNVYLGPQLSLGTSPLSGDILLVRDAAGALAQRNGTNPQTLRLYNTYTDASNYERLDLAWSASNLYIKTGSAGTMGVGNICQITSANFQPTADNSFDLGYSTAANRWRHVYAGTNIYAGGGHYMGNTTGAVGGALFGGSGVPAAGLGANGDYYLRTDAPGAAGTRIYVKSAGAWVATAA
jgi:hypothetical protein